MTSAQLARRTGMSEKHISQLVNARATLTMDVALQLERALDIPAQLWNSLEFNYRSELRREEERSSLKAFADWMRAFPVREMAKRGYLPADLGQDVVSRVEGLLGFFGVTSPTAWDSEWQHVTARFRKSPSFDPDRHALTAWLRQGEILAGGVRCEPYDEQRFRSALQRIRRLTTAPPDEFQGKAVDLCRSAGVALTLVPSLPGVAICGAARWLAADRAAIHLSLRHKSDDQLWFSFFHEACHVLEHASSAIYIDDAHGAQDGDAAERRANEFARDTLIPPDRYNAFVAGSGPMTLARIVDFADQVGVSPGVVVGRLQFDGRMPHTHGNALKRRFRWTFEEAP